MFLNGVCLTVWVNGCLKSTNYAMIIEIFTETFIKLKIRQYAKFGKLLP